MEMKTNLKIDWCSHEAAKFACEHYHYSKCIPKSKLVKIGVWEDSQFRGVVIFGVGATSSLVQSYGLKMTEGCELVRIALSRHSTPVTRIISIAIKFLKRSNPGLRLVVSFADPEQGHHGGIYQGGGWIYSGKSQASDEYIFQGKRWQGRSFRNSFKGMEKDPRVQIVKGSSKHRYLMPLDQEIRKQIESLRKPYPKRAGSIVADASVYQTEEGGAEPTPALQNKGKKAELIDG
jgi:hypothetical protein